MTAAPAIAAIGMKGPARRPPIAATAVAATMATDPETAIPGATGVATAIKAVQS